MRFLIFATLLQIKVVWNCHYDRCKPTKKGALNVHIVPHTHNDVGWVKTANEYYEYQVRNILDSVIMELWKDSNRRFMYVETSFFWQWWSEKNEKIKHMVRLLVREGRLKFIGGAWTMNDEATTHYQSIIDQFTWGLKKLNETFGVCAVPKVAWQIDPFGHSREFASLLAAMGYDGLFLCRIDSHELYSRRINKSMEFIWRGDDSLGQSSDIFTGVLYNHYTPPHGFNFGLRIRDDMFKNTEYKVRQFFEYITLLSKTYRTQNILIPMGDDFAYTKASIWFDNIDFLIKMANNIANKQNLNVNLLYSNPACYLKAVKDENPVLPTKQDDFFPYITDNEYWTGYYTSRPSLKLFEREANRYFQMIKQLLVMGDLDQPGDNFVLNELRSAMGIMQHHDAITGTEKQYVAEDYKQILCQAVDNSLVVVNKLFSKFAENSSNNFVFQFKRCQLNQSECTTSEKGLNFVTTVYNPLAWELFEFNVVVPVVKHKYIVYDSNGNTVDTQLVSISEWYFRNIPTRRSPATHELIFKVKSLEPLSFQSFYIQKVNTPKKINKVKANTRAVHNIFLAQGSSIISTIESGYYKGFQNSGAYLFHTNMTKPIRWYISTLRYQSIPNVYSQYVTAVIKQSSKKYHQSCVVFQIAWLCKPIPVNDKVGKDVVVRYNTNIRNEVIFYTDSNGRQMIKRKRTNGVMQNYFPVSNKITISDKKTRFTIITDRAEGGYSPKPGTVELMINRRHLRDDKLGVMEALDDGGSVNIVNHFIMMSDIKDKQSIVYEKKLNFEIVISPIILFSDASEMTLTKWLKMKKINTGLKKNFPLGLHLLTLEPWGKNKLLLRLENYLDSSDCLNDVIEINLCAIFKTFTILLMRETTLAANRGLQNNKRMIWRTQTQFNDKLNKPCKSLVEKERAQRLKYGNNCSKIRWLPKEIRTFIVDYQTNSI